MQPQERKVVRRIKQISIKDLFSIFHHIIPLNVNNRITIIHGPNGFGKTILLKLLDELFSKRSSMLQTIPFSEFRVDFEDGSSFWITKPSDSPMSRNIEITFHISMDGIEQESFNLKLPRVSLINKKLLRQQQRVLAAYYRRLSRSKDQADESLSAESVAEHLIGRTQLAAADLSIDVKGPDWLSKVRSSVAIHFIEAQRLLNSPRVNSLTDDESQIKLTVEEYSEELAKNIESILAKSATLSQSLDSTFPSRVVNPATWRDLTEQELRNKLVGLEEKRLRLMKVGLLDQESSHVFRVDQSIDDRTKFILSVYVEDIEKKLAIFDEIMNKIELLAKIINKRFSYKQIEISKEHGFIVKTSKGATLLPTDLSSGEQHELVLFYELLFKVAPGSLILIDEPEISLHTAWQVGFLKDLQEIVELADLNVLMATHSPDMIGNRWDLVVQLRGAA